MMKLSDAIRRGELTSPARIAAAVEALEKADDEERLTREKWAEEVASAADKAAEATGKLVMWCRRPGGQLWEAFADGAEQLLYRQWEGDPIAALEALAAAAPAAPCPCQRVEAEGEWDSELDCWRVDGMRVGWQRCEACGRALPPAPIDEMTVEGCEMELQVAKGVEFVVFRNYGLWQCLVVHDGVRLKATVDADFISEERALRAAVRALREKEDES